MSFFDVDLAATGIALSIADQIADEPLKRQPVAMQPGRLRCPHKPDRRIGPVPSFQQITRQPHQIDGGRLQPLLPARIAKDAGDQGRKFGQVRLSLAAHIGWKLRDMKFQPRERRRHVMCNGREHHGAAVNQIDKPVTHRRDRDGELSYFRRAIDADLTALAVEIGLIGLLRQPTDRRHDPTANPQGDERKQQSHPDRDGEGRAMPGRQHRLRRTANDEPAVRLIPYPGGK